MNPFWSDLVRSRAFWLGYISAAVDFRGCPTLVADETNLCEPPECEVALSLSLPADYALCLEILPGAHYLSLSSASLKQPLLVGTMDAHQMSDVFRWSEFQIVLTHLAAKHQPGWANELLLSWYVAVTADCQEAYLRLLRDCLSRAGVFLDSEVECILAYTGAFAQRRDFRWLYRPALGWVAEGKNCYSMRHRGGGFKFGVFRTFLSAMSADDPPDVARGC